MPELTLTSVLMAALIGYISGSIPFGLIITRMGGAGDVRSIGSGNIGATNVLRTGRKGLAAATLLLDAVKGLLPIFLVAELGAAGMAIAGVAAFIGHCYPIWLGFKGGKGIATFVGVALGFSWKVLLVFAVVWLGVAYLTRYSSLAALIATVATCIASWLLLPLPFTLALGAMTIITFWRHRENIARLRSGNEGKIGAKG